MTSGIALLQFFGNFYELSWRPRITVFSGRLADFDEADTSSIESPLFGCDQTFTLANSLFPSVQHSNDALLLSKRRERYLNDGEIIPVHFGNP